MDKTELELFAKSVAALEKLVNEVGRLRSDVVRLSSRIEPFENEPAFSPSFSQKIKPKNFREVLDLLESMRTEIKNAEFDIARIGARMDQIHNDSWSRDDIKPWIKR